MMLTITMMKIIVNMIITTMMMTIQYYQDEDDDCDDGVHDDGEGAYDGLFALKKVNL